MCNKVCIRLYSLRAAAMAARCAPSKQPINNPASYAFAPENLRGSGINGGPLGRSAWNLYLPISRARSASTSKSSGSASKGASVTGVRAGEFGRRNPEASQRNLKTLLGWASAGDIHTHISHRFPLEGAEEAFSAIAARKVIGKAVLTRSV